MLNYSISWVMARWTAYLYIHLYKYIFTEKYSYDPLATDSLIISGVIMQKSLKIASFGQC